MLPPYKWISDLNLISFVNTFFHSTVNQGRKEYDAQTFYTLLRRQDIHILPLYKAENQTIKLNPRFYHHTKLESKYKGEHQCATIIQNLISEYKAEPNVLSPYKNKKQPYKTKPHKLLPL